MTEGLFAIGVVVLMVVIFFFGQWIEKKGLV